MNARTAENANRTRQLTPTVLSVGLLLWLIAAGPAPATVPGGAAFIQQLGQQVITVLRASGGQRDAGIARFETLFADSFDVPFIARAALGRHARTLDAPQTRAYRAAFRDYVVSFYATKFAGYAGQEFIVTGEKQVDEKTSLVAAQLRGDGGKVMQLGFVVHRSVGGDLKIIDVAVEGVSLLVVKRSEFASVIGRRGPAALTALLRRKTAELRSAGS